MDTQTTIRLTTAQALIKFLEQQYLRTSDGSAHRFFETCFGIYGHGNVAGIGQALLEYPTLGYIPFRNEQNMVHCATAFARAHRRMKACICTSSIGPGATNMVTGAALSSINRLPVLLLPGDYFASRTGGTVLQQWRDHTQGDLSVNDSLRSVSVFWDRIYRSDQLIYSLLEAMRKLTSPSETGAVTICLPQDVQAEAFDYPISFFDRREWLIPRPEADSLSIDRAIDLINDSQRPIIIAGGGIRYSGAHEVLKKLVETLQAPLVETFAGKGSLPDTHPMHLGGIGVTGTLAANTWARNADLIIGIGTRFTDFISCSDTLFQNPNVQFLLINIDSRDAHSKSGLALTGDARQVIVSLLDKLSAESNQNNESIKLKGKWQNSVQQHYQDQVNYFTQANIIQALNSLCSANDVVINASGSMPGALHQLWQCTSPDQLHIEYGYSCMGYEIPAGIGASISKKYNRTFVLIGDGSYLMAPQEIVTAVQLNLTMTIILMDNEGYGSIGQLSEAVGAKGHGTSHHSQSGNDPIHIDYIQNAESLGAKGIHILSVPQFKEVILETMNYEGVLFLYCKVAKSELVENGAWWDVPIATTSRDSQTRNLRQQYDLNKKNQKNYIRPIDGQQN